MSQSVGPDRSVRPAQSGDARAIARLQREAWRSLMGQDALDAQGITEEALAAQWEATLASPRPDGTALLVALHGNTIVGFALAGPDEAGVPSAPEASPGEAAVAATQVYELTVDKNFRRSGHASRLLSAVADLTSGQLRVWVGVDDEERQRFYTSAGFAPSGAVRVLGDGPPQHMWWAERASAPPARAMPRGCVRGAPSTSGTRCAHCEGRAYHGTHEQHSSPPLRFPRSRHGHADDRHR